MQSRRITGSISALDDGSLLEILTWVGATDARDLANCRCVAKRWREVAWIVPRLAFRFCVESSDQLRYKERIIAGVLRGTRRAAPGCLKALKVTLAASVFCTDLLEVTGHWLVYAADSVVELELVLWYCNIQLNLHPAMWSFLSHFRVLKRLKIDGRFSWDLLPLANESPFITLTSCHLEESDSSATLALLLALCAACPMLKDLSVVACVDLNNVLIESPSLERFVLRPDCNTRWRWNELEAVLTVVLHTPRLASLYIEASSRAGMELSMASVESLRELRLYGSCVVRGKKQYNRVTHLHVDGTWKLDALVSLLQLTPMVTDLTMGRSLTARDEKIPIGKVFGPLANLKVIDFDCPSLKAFTGDDTGLLLDKVTVHVRVLEDPILKQLLDVYRVQMVVARACREKLLCHRRGMVASFHPGRRDCSIQ